ncbi:hypothetical protein TNCV_2310831 [Trichonephila clavipes]|nr:hypothetical protein TNCV_2310831 [Trichonephila clavipes]
MPHKNSSFSAFSGIRTQALRHNMGDRLTNTFTKDFCVRITNTYSNNEHILGGDKGYTPEIMEEILATARYLELEVNEDDIEELIMGHEDELTTAELQEILNEERQETQQNVSPSEQEEDERGPLPTSAIKDLLKKWADVRAMVLEGHPNQADVSRSLVYVDKPQTLDHLEDNIRRVIADIRPQMLEKVIENWTSRLDYIRASRGSPMPEIIFKM